MLKLFSLSLLTTLLFVACTNHSSKIPKKTNFNELDTNQDKKISLHEYIVYREKRDKDFLDKSLNSNFEVCDKNSDGKITIDELVLENQVVPRIYGEIDSKNPKYACFVNKKQFSFFDKNGDKMITRDELERKRFPYSFEKDCDLNNDKRVDRKEATSKTCGYPNDEFTIHDLNKDGFITRREIKHLNMQNSFKTYDKNRDGSLDLNEFRDVSFFGDALD